MTVFARLWWGSDVIGSVVSNWTAERAQRYTEAEDRMLGRQWAAPSKQAQPLVRDEAAVQARERKMAASEALTSA